MKILIIDNFDSFTYNIHHLVNKFIFKCDVIRSDRYLEVNLNHYDKIIFSPGPSLPSNHPLLFHILEQYSDKKSILGICLGHQAIAEYFGGKIKNMDRVMHGVVSKNIILLDDPLFNDIPGKFNIGHYHSWVVDELSFPSDLVITSKNQDGLLMSISHKYLDICGVQFHPESVLTPYGEKIIENWIRS